MFVSLLYTYPVGHVQINPRGLFSQPTAISGHAVSFDEHSSTKAVKGKVINNTLFSLQNDQ